MKIASRLEVKEQKQPIITFKKELEGSIREKINTKNGKTIYRTNNIFFVLDTLIGNYINHFNLIETIKDINSDCIIDTSEVFLNIDDLSILRTLEKSLKIKISIYSKKYTDINLVKQFINELKYLNLVHTQVKNLFENKLLNEFQTSIIERAYNQKISFKNQNVLIINMYDIYEHAYKTDVNNFKQAVLRKISSFFRLKEKFDYTIFVSEDFNTYLKIRQNLFADYSIKKYTKKMQQLIEEFENQCINTYKIKNFMDIDTIASLTKFFIDREANVVIASTNTILYQIVSDKVEIYNPFTRELKNKSQIEKEIGISTEKYLDFISFIGNKEQNINKITGFGVKKTIKTLEKYNSLQEFLNNDNKTKTESELVEKYINSFKRNYILGKTYNYLSHSFEYSKWEWDNSYILSFFMNS